MNRIRRRGTIGAMTDASQIPESSEAFDDHGHADGGGAASVHSNASAQDTVAALLNDAGAGNAQAANELLPLVYAQLRRIAQQRMNEERRDHTLQATALVHEAYARLLGGRPVQWQNRAHFYFAAARAMREILVDHARSRGRLKRGGDGSGRPAQRVPLEVADLAMESDGQDILALNEAVDQLEAQEPDVAAVVYLRFFAGLTGEEVGQCLGISPRQVDRHWAYARTWLFERMRSG